MVMDTWQKAYFLVLCSKWGNGRKTGKDIGVGGGSILHRYGASRDAMAIGVSVCY